MTTILGIDYSLTACGLVAAPLDWDGDWKRVAWRTVGERLPKAASDVQRARRTESIAIAVKGFAAQHGATLAYFESYAYAQAKAAHSIAEGCGVCRLELVRAGIEVKTSPMASGRKLLLGKVPRSGEETKFAVYRLLREAGAPVTSYDLADAFTVLNWGMSELGGFCFAQAAA